MDNNQEPQNRLTKFYNFEKLLHNLGESNINIEMQDMICEEILKLLEICSSLEKNTIANESCLLEKLMKLSENMMNTDEFEVNK